MPSRRGPSSRRRRGDTDGDKMAILVRADMRMTPGRVATYTASIAIRLFQRVCGLPNACAAWNKAGQRKVVLRVDGQDRVRDVIRYARDHNVAIAGVRVKVSPDGKEAQQQEAQQPKQWQQTQQEQLQQQKRMRRQLSGRRDQQPVSAATGELADPVYTWVAVGIFGPNNVIDAMTRGLHKY